MEVRQIEVMLIDNAQYQPRPLEECDILAESILEIGLIHPITVYEEGTRFKLIAGARRHEAVRITGRKHIAARVFGDHEKPDEHMMRAIELAENDQREDMTPLEKARLTRKVHQLWQEKNGKAVGGVKGGQSMEKTGELLNTSKATVSRDIMIANMADKLPDLELEKCSTQAEAIKKIKQFKARVDTAHASNEVQSGRQTLDKELRTLISSYSIGDCLKELPKIPDNSMDFIECDPPYGIDLHDNKRGGADKAYGEIRQAHYIEFMREVLTECYRTLKQDRWIVVWYGMNPWHQEMLELLQSVGFNVPAVPCIWWKGTGQTNQPNRILGNTYETFFYACKGEAHLSKPGRGNIFQYGPVAGTKKYHPTQKPLSLYCDIYATFSRPGQRALVPFLGSGQSIIAAYMEKVTAIGFDLSNNFRDGYVMSCNNFIKTAKGLSEDEG